MPRPLSNSASASLSSFSSAPVRNPESTKLSPRFGTHDSFERSPGSASAELTWLAPALAQAAGETKSPSAWTYLKGAGKVVGRIASVFLTIGALGVLALLQSAESSANPKPKD